MSKTRTRRRLERARERIDAIRSEITGFELVASGSLTRRMTRCGKPNCRCAKDPEARHGPYYEWGRMEKGRQVSTFVAADVAAELRAAIKAYRRIRALLRRWERESVQVIEGEADLSREQGAT